MCKSIVCLFVSLSAGSAIAATVWNPADNGVFPPDTGKWGVAANWTNGLPSAVADGKAQFNRSGAAECVVSDAQSCTLFVQGDNGPGGVIRVVDGGRLATGVSWSAVGYNNVAHMIVEAGGSVTCGQHLWVGNIGPSVGTLDINGGYVRVSEMFGIGWQSGKGTVHVNAGHLDLHNIHATDSIKVDSILNITKGIVTIDGNHASKIEAYIAAGRIRGYDGRGTARCDYGVTNPGKTTIWAEPLESGRGDIDGDGDVDRADLSLFAQQWLDEGEESQADLTRDEKVDMRDYSVLAANWRTSDGPYYTTLDGTIMCGYQGWFNAPGDGANRGWVHWGRSGRFEPGYCTVDFWPDMTEYDDDEKFATGFQYADGGTAHVFSSHSEKTVLRHFSWMAEFGIDGVFLQRFATETTPGSTARNHRDKVMLHCRKGANQYRRAWAMMYDISGLGQGGTQRVIDDWKYLVDTYGVSQEPADQAYLRHNGKPVLAIWGIGFKDRAYTLDECLNMVTFFKEDPVYGGLTVMLGIPSYWRTLGGDCVNDSKIYDIINRADVISPWAVGRFGSKYESELDNYANNVWVQDIAWCDARDIEYMPVVFPGFSWYNLQGKGWDQMPRLGGRFLWRQYYKAIHEAGATMIYQAMFDEVDEGTAIFKCTPRPPASAENPFLPTGNTMYPPYDISDSELPSDHYLWLVGQGGRMLRGEIAPTATMPGRPGP